MSHQRRYVLDLYIDLLGFVWKCVLSLSRLSLSLPMSKATDRLLFSIAFSCFWFWCEFSFWVFCFLFFCFLFWNLWRTRRGLTSRRFKPLSCWFFFLTGAASQTKKKGLGLAVLIGYRVGALLFQKNIFIKRLVAATTAVPLSFLFIIIFFKKM